MPETLFIETTLLNSFVGEDSWVVVKARDDLLAYKRQYESAGKQFFTRTDVRMFLTRLGISSAVNLYEKRNWVV